jgi:hypothetical protein
VLLAWAETALVRWDGLVLALHPVPPRIRIPPPRSCPPLLLCMGDKRTPKAVLRAISA